MAWSSPAPESAFREITPAHLSSRTKKRFRNGRPSEDIVYQRTVSLLYSAQKSHPGPALDTSIDPNLAEHEQEEDGEDEEDDPSSTSSTLPPQKTSLHTFWNLPSRPLSQPSQTPPEISASLAPQNAPPASSPAMGMGTGMPMEDAMDLDTAHVPNLISVPHVSTTCAFEAGAAMSMPMSMGIGMTAGTEGRTWVGGLGWL
ncbi:MAG: hypothetical protein M4579_007039 [Chaenotheca gracillima]|nr:MAG: hypothetical protein M4579_007039 [Chaenotheca gracillima]